MYQEVLGFWFEELTPAQWWVKDESLDKLIHQRFATLHQAAANAELFNWRASAHGRLAEVIVLDQFSRNMFRDTANAFAFDPLALILAQEAITAGAEQALSALEKSFLYMPFMHSESALIHQQAVKLYQANGIESNYQFELKHQEIIERFGRYPHRNKILGRESTALEIEFLKGPNSAF
ncbi:MAG: DUF924 family protein [Thalassotalea sp.]